MPAFYHRNVMRSLNIKLRPANTPDMENVLRQKDRAQLRSVDNSAVPARNRKGVRRMVAAIHAIVAAKVIFVKMPTSGMVEEIESRQFPRHEFWVPFSAAGGGTWHMDPGLAWTPSVSKHPTARIWTFVIKSTLPRTLIRAAGLEKRTTRP